MDADLAIEDAGVVVVVPTELRGWSWQRLDAADRRVVLQARLCLNERLRFPAVLWEGTLVWAFTSCTSKSPWTTMVSFLPATLRESLGTSEVVFGSVCRVIFSCKSRATVGQEIGSFRPIVNFPVLY